MIRKAACVSIVLSALCFQLKAQYAPAADTLLEPRVLKLENIISRLPKISGFVNLRYQYNGLDETNGFDIRRARLDVRGDIGSKFGYRLQVEFANNPKVLDAYVDWKIKANYVMLRAGQYKIPFSLENPYSPTGLETIDNSIVIINLAGYADVAGIVANGRDIGLNLSGGFLHREGFSIINYSVGVFNGSGINTSDNNKYKDFSGMLTINPIRHLSLAAYHYNGWAGGEANIFRRLRTGGGVRYDDGRWLARGEYIRGKTGSIKSEGAYAVVGWFVHKTLQPVLKYDYFQRDVTNNDTSQNWYTVGLNYVPIKYIRLQLNYSYRTSQIKDFHYMAAQFMGIF